MLLGDALAKAIETVGIDKVDVEAFLGEECGCGDRQEKLNALDRWARQSVKETAEAAKTFFQKITGGWR